MSEQHTSPQSPGSAAGGGGRFSPYPLPTRCPICDGELHVARLHCGQCRTALEGDFTLGRLGRLGRDQLQFVEAFLRRRGKIKDVEEDLGVSYPTVVARLNEVVRALGFELPAEEETASARRQRILDELAAGTITAAEAATRLRGPGMERGA